MEIGPRTSHMITPTLLRLSRDQALISVLQTVSQTDKERMNRGLKMAYDMIVWQSVGSCTRAQSRKCTQTGILTCLSLSSPDATVR